jgi:hypothetical protein
MDDVPSRHASRICDAARELRLALAAAPPANRMLAVVLAARADLDAIASEIATATFLFNARFPAPASLQSTLHG